MSWRPHEPSRDSTLEAAQTTVLDRAVAIVRRPLLLKGNTLKVFDADAQEQLPIQKKLRDTLEDFRKISGSSVAIIFYTREETRRLYADFVDKFPHHCHYIVEVDFGGKRKFFCDLCGGAY